MIRIESKTNERVKRVCRLMRSASARRDDRLFVLEGLRLCCDAAQNGVIASEVFVTERFSEKYPAQVALLEKNADRVFLTDEAAFAKMCDTDSSQGVISVIPMSSAEHPWEWKSDGRYVACESVSDPSNLGAIARTAEALGVSGLMLFGSCCDRYNPKAMRASMGALLRLPVLECTVADLARLSDFCLESYATVVDPEAESIHTAGFHAGSVVFIGNEANGLSPELVEQCDRRITIPIAGRAESFNAAAAAAIVLWELMKA